MPEQSWLEISKKRNKGYLYVLVVLAILGAAVFLHNNRELFFSKSSGPKKTLETEAVIGKKTRRKWQKLHSAKSANFPG